MILISFHNPHRATITPFISTCKTSKEARQKLNTLYASKSRTSDRAIEKHDRLIPGYLAIFLKKPGYSANSFILLFEFF